MQVAKGRRFGRLPGCAVLVLALLVSSSVRAEHHGRSIGFSNLIVRLERDPEIAVAGADYRVSILENLRAAGLNAVGAEDLVFGKDDGKRADLLLGGTIRELQCRQSYFVHNCRIGIEWRVLDVQRDAVVYTALTRYVLYRIPNEAVRGVGKQLVVGALGSLARRQGMRALLAEPAALPDSDPAFTPRGIGRCGAPAREMPKSAEDVLAATALVRSKEGFGSGFFVSNDGLLLTAAHVIRSPEITVRFRDGVSRPAVVLRRAPNKDAALLRVTPASSGPGPCLDVEAGSKTVGANVYAIGSPASEQLAFSLTRGILSGVRIIDGSEFLQTDASISPGNSGGPLVDDKGRVSAIVSWKVASARVEGVAFGIPIDVALAALGISMTSATDAALLAERSAFAGSAGPSGVVADVADALPSLDPEGDAARAREAAAARAREDQRDLERRRSAITPVTVPILRWGGLVLAGAGVVGAYVSSQGIEKNQMTESDYESKRLVNDLSWVGVGVGAAAFTLSFFFVPSLDDERLKRPRAAVGVVPVGGGAAFRWKGEF